MAAGVPPRPPDTISDEQWASLRRRAEKANPLLMSLTDPESIRYRLLAARQYDRRTEN